MTVATTQLKVSGLGIETLDLRDASPEPPLVLLHEGLGSVALWRGLPEELHRATGRRTIAFSRFGHGRSAPPPSPRTPAFFHEEALEVLPELLRRLAVREPVLVGHSDGASIAVIYAAHHPVAALVLLAPHVFVEDVAVDEIRDTRKQFLSGGLRERMSRHHDDPAAAFWGWCDVWLDPAFRPWTLDSETSRLTVPTLLIQGADDPYGSLAQLDRVEAHARGPIQRLVLPGGHSPHVEHPVQVVQAISDFVSAGGSHTID